MKRALALLLLLPLAGGCTKQLDRIEVRLDEVHGEQREMLARQDALAGEIDRLQLLVGEVEEGERERKAAIEVQIGALDRAVRQMVARSEEQEALLQRLRDALDILLRSGSTVNGDSLSQGGNSSPGTDVFDAAFADFTRGNHALARSGFEELLRRYPSSDLADDAAYWLAETWYAEGEYEDAKGYFEANLQAFPRSDTLPATLLKIGFCEIELQRAERARLTFNRLVREFPLSDEARIAEYKLASLPEGR